MVLAANGTIISRLRRCFLGRASVHILVCVRGLVAFGSYCVAFWFRRCLVRRMMRIIRRRKLGLHCI